MRARERNFYIFHTGSGVHLTFYLSRYQGSCPDEHKISVGVNLTTHFNLAAKFGISGAVRLLPTPPDMTLWCRQGKKNCTFT